MLFLVRTKFTPPTILTPSELAELKTRERLQAHHLQKCGTLVEIWREPPDLVAWGLWDVEDESALNAALDSLPCRQYMSVEPHSVVLHPNSLTPQ